ncbi:MAG: ABC transporter permease, partial [Pseudomonadota bacterium]
MGNLLSRNNLVKWAPLLVLFALILFFAAIEPRFFSVRNFARIAISSAPMLMVAVGVTFIIIMGSIDLSMEGTISVCAVIFAFTFIYLGGTLASWAWLALPLALIVGAAVGFINGLAHVKLKIPSFMASLAMGFVGTGFALLMTGGDRIRVEDDLFRGLLTTRWFNFPVIRRANPVPTNPIARDAMKEGIFSF